MLDTWQMDAGYLFNSYCIKLLDFQDNRDTITLLSLTVSTSLVLVPVLVLVAVLPKRIGRHKLDIPITRAGLYPSSRFAKPFVVLYSL